MAEDREVKVRLTADAAGLQKGFGDAAQSAKGLGKETDDAGKKADASAERFKSLARKAAAAFAGLQIGKFLGDSVRAASDLEQSMGAVEAVFKDSADAVKAFARTASQEVGLSEAAYSQMAAVFGSQLKNMGVAQAELAPKTNELIRLGADLAAQFGGTTAEAVGALSSLLRGERDPIERYGVSINEAKIKAELAAKGLDKLTGKAGDNAKVTATLDLLYRQTADAQGTFARESDTLAGKQARMQAALEDTKARIGAGLLPVVGDLVEMFRVYLLPVIEAVGKTLSILIQGFQSLPAPVKAFAVALTAMGLAKHFGLFDALKGAVGKLVGAFQDAGGAGATFGQKMGSVARAIGPSLGMAAFAGVVGFAVGKLQESNRAIDELESAYTGLTQALVDNGGAWDENIRKQLQANIINSAAFKDLVERTGDYRLSLEALMGSQEAQTRIVESQGGSFGLAGAQVQAYFDTAARGKIAVEEGSKAIRDFNAAAKESEGGWAALSTGLDKMTDRAERARDAMSGSGGGLGSQITMLGRHIASTIDSVEKWARPWIEWGTAVEQSVGSLSEAWNTMTRFERIASDASRAQKELAEQTDRVRAAMDKLNGKNIDAETAMRDLNEWVANLSDNLKDSKGNIISMSDAFDSNTRRIDTNTAAGRRLYDVVRDGRTKMVDAYQAQLAFGLSADEATEALDGQYQSLVSTLQQMGLTESQIDVLLGSYGLIPSQIGTFVGMDAEQAMQKISNVLGQLGVFRSTLWSAPVDADTSGAGGKVANLKWSIGQGASLPVSADTSTANYQIEQFRRAWQAARIVMKVVATGGGVSGGPVGAIAGFAGGGKIPGSPPNRREDDRWGIVDGRVPIRVQSSEYIVNSKATALNPKTLAAMNFGGLNVDKLLGFYSGGSPGGRTSERVASVQDARGRTAPLIGQLIMREQIDPFRAAQEIDRLVAWRSL